MDRDQLASLRLRLTAWVVVCLLCAGGTALLWRSVGPLALVFALPAGAMLLALPMVTRHVGAGLLLRWFAWGGIEGRYYAYRGRWIDVQEDAAGQRWLRLAHVRRVLPDLPPDARLAALLPGRVRRAGPHALLIDDALLEWLARARSPEALRLRRWLEREVVLPGRRRRELGRAAARPRPERD